MKKTRLGSSDIHVSNLSLGTMTFGRQIDQRNANRLLDVGCDAGINFIDTAEIYPSPASKETYGVSEEMLGRWLKRSGLRQKLILATKVCGPGKFVKWVRNGVSKFDPESISSSVNESLKRLSTEYIDLVQLHWPDRATNFFGKRGFKPPKEELDFDIVGTLKALTALVQQGKIRHIGLCNETPWGLMTFLYKARQLGLEKVVSLQSPYNLLNRQIEIGITEVAWRENLGILAYSPLANGLLTGKYHSRESSKNFRINRHAHYKRFRVASSMEIAAKYLNVFRKFEINPTKAALKWVASQACVCSVIIGVSDERQLVENLNCLETKLPKDLQKSLEKLHKECPDPCL